MLKLATALIAALLAGWVLAGSATTASAHHRGSGCCGGPISPTYYYKTVHPQRYETVVRDRSVYKHVHKIHRIVHITRVQPIIHVHVVTRVHHHTIVHVSDSYRHVTVRLPPIRYVYGSTSNTYDCRCGRPHHCW